MDGSVAGTFGFRAPAIVPPSVRRVWRAVGTYSKRGVSEKPFAVPGWTPARTGAGELTLSRWWLRAESMNLGLLVTQSWSVRAVRWETNALLPVLMSFSASTG